MVYKQSHRGHQRQTGGYSGKSSYGGASSAQAIASAAKAGFNAAGELAALAKVGLKVAGDIGGVIGGLLKGSAGELITNQAI